jgi:putative phosphoesterase
VEVILGIFSDTHGQERTAARALRVLKQAGAEAFVLCGDVGGEGVLDHLAGLRAWFVWGNTDHAGPWMNAYARALGLTPPAGVPLRLELAGRSLAVFHGHEADFGRLMELVNSGRDASLAAVLPGVDYVLFGHWHTPCDDRVGSVRLINPGALYRARTRSVATLDLRRDLLRFWQVAGEETVGLPLLIELPRPQRGR